MISSRDNSFNPKKSINQIAFKKDPIRQSKQKILSMNTNALEDICIDLKNNLDEKDVT